jgi:hypothetical protein
VIRDWCGARFGAVFYEAHDRGAHFRECVGVAGAVPMRRLLRPKIEAAVVADLGS